MNWLPTVDWDMGVLSNLKVRAGVGYSIGRPRWDQIQAAPRTAATPASSARRRPRNWRGQFLYTTAENSKANPGYTEPYGQVDLSVGYNVNKNLSVSLEGINLTNATQRNHGRTDCRCCRSRRRGRAT